MLLNCLAQPTFFKSLKTHVYLDEFKNAPLLLCHKNAMEDNVLPSDWSGDVFATQEVLNDARVKEQFQRASMRLLRPNEAYVTKLVNDDRCQYKAKNVELTAIPLNKDYLMYLIKDDNVVSLLTDLIIEDMTAFVQNKILRNSIKSGIDVLYINDGVYQRSELPKTYPSEFLLGVLATIVRPRFIKGFFSDEELPPRLGICCMNHEN